VTAVLIGGLFCGPAPCASEAASLPWRTWRTIEMKARSGLFRGTVQMRLSGGPAEGRRLEVQTVARFLGATVGRSTTVTQFDAQGRVTDYSSSSKKRGRRFHFGERGYTVEKLRPRGDANAPLDAWEVAARAEFPYPETASGQPGRVLDYYGMLLRLHEHKLAAPGDEVSLVVATASGPRTYRVRVREGRTSEREVTDLSTGKRTTARVRELRLSIAPEDPTVNEGFLNMEGETELWVEAESKTLLEVGGKLPNVGKVKLLLTAIG
jgi:hypothetical protein